MQSPPGRPGAAPCTGATSTAVHTAHLEPGDLLAVRCLLAEAFDGNFGDDDWQHSQGGLHVLLRDGERLIAHGAVVQRRLLHGGRTLRVGYVEAVAVDPRERRRGHAARVMVALEDVIRRAYDAGALSATDEGALLYTARGWQPWRGSTWALRPTGRIRTPEDDDAVFVFPGKVPLDPVGELTCDWREGDLW